MACLLDHGADINAWNDDGETPLLLADIQNHLPVVELLLLRVADLNLVKNERLSPFLTAAAKGHLEIIHCMVDGGADHGADVNQADAQDEATPFF